MSIKKRIAFIIFSIATLLSLLFAGLYLFNPRFMSYHADALGRSWTEVDREFQILIITLMRTCGGGWLATGCAMIIFLSIPFRRENKQKWPGLACGITGLGVSVPSLAATLIVKFNTPANPPWMAAAIAIVLLLAGIVLVLVDKEQSA